MAFLTDGKKTRAFPLLPEQIVTSVRAEYATNSVLDTAAPVVSRKSSQRTIRLGKVLLISQGQIASQQQILDSLQYWARSGTRLTFNHQKQGLKACHISSLNFEVKRWKNGAPVWVEMDLELIEAALPLTPKAAAKPAIGKRATPNQQQKKTNTVKSKLKTPTKKVALGITGDYSVAVSSLSEVSITSDGVTQQYDYDDLIDTIG